MIDVNRPHSTHARERSSRVGASVTFDFRVPPQYDRRTDMEHHVTPLPKTANLAGSPRTRGLIARTARNQTQSNAIDRSNLRPAATAIHQVRTPEIARTQHAIKDPLLAD